MVRRYVYLTVVWYAIGKGVYRAIRLAASEVKGAA